ncbi:hypothetical protein R3W88_011965 [Solanum pinnatisectum]|uniref:Uncharacterized protein n=1 Tax=Solanum pinnatisectum TaxID=50273 RepID=A0AAV9L7M6_9SOLN|nr:hypothetical protein R3W88_011965 [Solanum pinnatisectum]
MVLISTKGKEKVTDERSKRRPFTRSDSKKMMGDAMRFSILTTAENRKKMKSSVEIFEIPATDVVDVSIDGSEHESVKEVSKEKGKNKLSNLEKERTIINNLRQQNVLGGRVFDMDIILKPGMDSLHDLLEIQSWLHLFQIKSPILHEEEVRESYYNIDFGEDGSITSRVGNKNLYLDEDLLGQILAVPRGEIRSLVKKTYTTKFVKECSKIPNTCRAGIQKKLIKGLYQLLFEFVNKVLLPRMKKRTAATSTNLYLMEALSRFEPIDLPALMMEHLYKTVIDHKRKHGMGYGYFLTKVFHYLNIPVGTGKIGTAKQAFTLTTMVECECIEGKTGPLSKISQLVMEQDQLKHELEEMTVRVSNKDAEIALLKTELLKAQTEGPGTEVVKELHKQNDELLAKIATLQEKAIKDNDKANTRLTLVIKSLSHQPPSS